MTAASRIQAGITLTRLAEPGSVAGSDRDQVDDERGWTMGGKQADAGTDLAAVPQPGSAAGNMAAAMVVGLATYTVKKVLDASWRRTMGKEPPTVPDDVDVDLREAVAWALISGVAVGLVQLAAARAAARYRRRRRAAR